VNDEFIPPWFLGEEGIDAYLRADNYVILDFETTNLNIGTATNPDNKIVLACWTVVRDGQEVNRHAFGDEYEMQELLDDINKADFVVAHNAQFELTWLARCGLDLRTVLCYDTMVMEWVIHGNQPVPFNLEDTALRYGLEGKDSLVSRLIKLKVCPSVIPRSWLLRYCEIDVDQCHKLFKLQSDRLSSLDLWHIALSRNLTIPCLADMQLQGLQLDKEIVAAEEERLQEVVETLGQELDLITGGINLGSPKQLGILLYDTLKFTPLKDRDGEVIKTPGGSMPTSESIMFQLVAETEDQIKFLELYKKYNNAVTLLSKNLTFFGRVCKYLDGVFYGAIGHCRTKTHRLASSAIKLLFPGVKTASGVQLQNLPRQFKGLFTCHDPDYENLEADGAGMEFRIATILGHDAQGEFDIVNGTDVHAFTRDTMNKAYIKHGINKEIDRQDAKSSTFTPLFWGMGKDAAEAEYAEAFKKKYNGIYEEQKKWTLAVAANGKLTTPYGMIFYWPNVKLYRSGYVKYSTEIVNVPIQGLATAEVIPVALVHFWHRTKGMPIYIWNTVHDSIVSRVRKDYMDVAKELSKVAMTSDVYKFFKDVYRFEFTTCPLGVGLKHGSHWGKSNKEEIYDVWVDGNERYTVEENKVKTVIYDTRNQF
jgi:DNA polymerase I-like protein with 3'-5' exonuclease and polymerase domains